MGKYITDAHRLSIEHMLKEHASLKSIAKAIGKSLKTITREIAVRSVESHKSAVGRVPNRCLSRRTCEKR